MPHQSSNNFCEKIRIFVNSDGKDSKINILLTLAWSIEKGLWVTSAVRFKQLISDKFLSSERIIRSNINFRYWMSAAVKMVCVCDKEGSEIQRKTTSFFPVSSLLTIFNFWSYGDMISLISSTNFSSDSIYIVLICCVENVWDYFKGSTFDGVDLQTSWGFFFTQRTLRHHQPQEVFMGVSIIPAHFWIWNCMLFT